MYHRHKDKTKGKKLSLKYFFSFSLLQIIITINNEENENDINTIMRFICTPSTSHHLISNEMKTNDLKCDVSWNEKWKKEK